MVRNKRNFLICSILSFIAIIFTVLVMVVDVKAIGVNESSVGFATINKFVHEAVGVNMMWYNITDWLGIIPVFMAVCYAFIGFIQLVKRRSIFKVDKEIILLGLFYIAVVSLYVLFELFIVNYRPILMDGVLEASYPSSHTLIAICFCGSFIIMNKKLFNNRFSKVLNVVSFVVALVIVVGRLLSGVHWFTDIVGGLLISSSLLMIFYSLIIRKNI